MRPQLIWTLLALSSVAQSIASSQDSRLLVRDEELTGRSIQTRSLIDDIWNDIKNAATCTACQGVLVILKGLAGLGDKPFVDVITGICKLSKAEADDVCDGAIALEGPIIANSLRQIDIGSDASKLFCGSFLGLCPEPAVPQWDIQFPSPKPQTSRPAPSGKTPIKIVQYSDIHVDPLYVPGSSTDCDEPLCCRPYTAADEPGNSTSPAGPNGDHKCDSPVSLEVSMYQAIKQIVPDAAFSLFTGDIVDHSIWNTSQAYNEKSIDDAYGLMSQYLGLVYGTAGNHESSPTNAFPSTAVSNSSQWLYDTLTTQWARWLGPQDESEVEHTGAYSTKFPNGNLRIISLNTNMYYRMNFWLYQKNIDRDPNGQVQWLVNELDAAEKAGERVYIIGHTPLGESDAFHQGSHYIDQIVNRYDSTIAAMFFGHTHADHFEVSYSNYSSRDVNHASMVSYICPSLTPMSGMPAFRVYEVDPDTFGVLDTTTYIADMTNAAFQTTGPVWTEYYSAKDVYGSKLSPPVTDPNAELTPAFWHNVTTLFETNSDVFNAYISRKSRGWNTANCTGDCQTQEICQTRAGRSENNCAVVSPGIHFTRKRSEQEEAKDKHYHHHHKHHNEECGVSPGMRTLSAFVTSKDLLEELYDRYNDAARQSG